MANKGHRNLCFKCPASKSCILERDMHGKTECDDFAKAFELTVAFDPCPFCGKLPSYNICDDEGNDRDESYISDPWSGLGFRLTHIECDSDDPCPISTYNGESLGRHIYDTPNEVAIAWNSRVVK